MIPSLDTYVYTQLKYYIDQVLLDEDMVDVALRNIDTHAKTTFKQTFMGKDPKKDITYSYQFPQQKEKFDARIVVQIGASSRVTRDGSLGNVNATNTYRDEGTVNETIKLTPHPDPSNIDDLVLEVEHTVGEFLTSDTLTLPKEHITYEENRILIPYAFYAQFIGLDVDVTYTIKGKDGDVKSLDKGYTSQETVEVTPLSNNMDTMRCLDAIIRMVLIILEETPEQQDDYQLQGHQIKDMIEMAHGEDSLDMKIFSRPYTLAYLTKTSIDYDIVRKVTEINLHGSGGTILDRRNER